jgi:hypothetical protein
MCDNTSTCDILGFQSEEYRFTDQKPKDCR